MFRAHINDGVAWVTGASSGIGRAVALELARRGYRVAVTARRGGELNDLVTEANGHLGSIRAYGGDIVDAAGIAEVVNRIETEQGPIALAFLNAGIYVPDAPDHGLGEGFAKTLDVNLQGTANSLAPLIRCMRERGRGHIAIMASMAGLGGLPQATGYGASKAALIHMAESLRLTLASAGITVQVVNPGFVETSLTGKSKGYLPFRVPLREAARRICDGFQSGGFEIAFPKRLAWLLKAVRVMPYSAYFWLVRRATRGRHRADAATPGRQRS